MKQGKKLFIFEILFLFLFSFLPYVWLKPGEVVMGHDSGFRINFLSYYKSLFYAWNPIMNLGIDWQLYKGFLMTQFPEFVGTVLTGSWEMGQRLMMQYWLFLIPSSMYALTAYLFPEKKQRLLRISASLLYVFNFFILQGMFIVERAKFSLYAALPLAILLFHRTLVGKKRIIPNAVLFGLLYFFCSGGGSPPLYGATLVVLPVTFLFFSFLSWRQDGIPAIKRSVIVGVMFVIAFVGMNAYWIIPQAKLYTETYGTAVADRGGIDGLLAWERVNSKNASLMNLVRLEGIPDWYDNPIHPFSSLYIKNPFLIIASFIPIICIGATFIFHLWKRKKAPPAIVLMGILLAIGLVLAGGTHPPFGVFYEYAMRHVPGFAIFRSSIYKFGPILWFSMSLLFGYSAWFLVSLVGARKVRMILSLGIVIFVIAYHFPFFTGTFFRFHERFTTKVTIPHYVSDMASWVNTETKPESRIMVLPELTSSFYNIQMDAYTWGFFSLDILPRNAIDRSIVANDNNADSVIHRLYAELSNGTPESFSRLASLLGIEYILWRDDALYSPTMTTGRTIEAQREKLKTLPVQLVEKKGAWELYKLSNPPKDPIWTLNHAVCGDGVTHPTDYVLSKESDIVVLEKCPAPVLFEANCLHCNLLEYQKMVSDTVIAPIKYPPGNVFFSRIFDREKDAFRSVHENPEQLFDAYLAKANTRVGLLRFSDEELSKTGLTRQSIVSDYLDAITKGKEIVIELTGRQKNVYAIRFLLFIDVHRKELGSAYPDVENVLSEDRSVIAPLAWLTTDSREPKYELEIPEDGTFMMTIANVSATPSVMLDGVQINSGAPVFFSKGYHKVAVLGGQSIDGAAPILFFEKTSIYDNNRENPSVTFVKKDPTRFLVQINNTKEPYTLVFNERFDDRWILTYVDSEGKTITLPRSSHFRANGSVNAWVITDPSIQRLTISYEPQKYFLFGAVISVITLLTAGGYMMIFRR